MTRTVVIGLLGLQKDSPSGSDRWDRWRPTVSLCQHDDLVVDRLELLVEEKGNGPGLAKRLSRDIASISPETETRVHPVRMRDPWDFAEVYALLRDFADRYPFDPENEEYLVHITTGTHVVQICLFLLTETRHLPARLIQTSPALRSRGRSAPGFYKIIDLDLSRYDALAARFAAERREGVSFLKDGVETKNAAFNGLMDRIEEVSLASNAPILLTGPTGTGKTQLARRIYALKHRHHQVQGELVEVNCATLRGDAAMSTLFGHEKGAFTGALTARDGLLRTADKGLVFLDEIGELGLDEQAMLLRALEEGTFLPLGSDRPVQSRFQLIAGTHRDLAAGVREGRFREDLLARIDLWSFALPALRERLEDVEPNLEWQLERHANEGAKRVTFNREAREAFLRFATGRDALWSGNFRDFNAALLRLATLARGGRITRALVDEEIERLRAGWRRLGGTAEESLVERALGSGATELDRFDRVQLEDVLAVCCRSSSLSAAGRVLFERSLERKKSKNDADRLAKYLARFGLRFGELAERLT